MAPPHSNRLGTFLHERCLFYLPSFSFLIHHSITWVKDRSEGQRNTFFSTTYIENKGAEHCSASIHVRLTKARPHNFSFQQSLETIERMAFSRGTLDIEASLIATTGFVWLHGLLYSTLFNSHWFPSQSKYHRKLLAPIGWLGNEGLLHPKSCPSFLMCTGSALRRKAS